MTSYDLLKSQLDDAGGQLTRLLESMPEQAMDHKATSSAMTPREQIAHLMEAYQAFLAAASGGKYEWGTFKPASMETDALVTEFQSLRHKAVVAALTAGNDETLIEAHKYILGHDYYHVGQICLSRLAVQSDWNPYAIYGD